MGEVYLGIYAPGGLYAPATGSRFCVTDRGWAEEALPVYLRDRVV